MVLKLTRSSQRPACSSDYKKTLNEILPNTFTTSNPFFLLILMCTQMTMLFMCTDDTKIKQICKLINMNEGCIHDVK